MLLVVWINSDNMLLLAGVRQTYYFMGGFSHIGADWNILGMITEIYRNARDYKEFWNMSEMAWEKISVR